VNRVLVIAAHPDDEVLGCGGTIAKHIMKSDSVHILILSHGVDSRNLGEPNDRQKKEKVALQQQTNSACGILGATSVAVANFPDNQCDTVPLLHIVKRVEAEILRVTPEIVYTHHSGDLNVDHQIAFQATVTACRPLPDNRIKSVFSYEVPSSTDWAPSIKSHLFAPNYFVDISSTLSKKLQALKAYTSELRDFPHSRSLEAVESLAKWRGANCGVRAAEAFVTIRRIE
jgi:N-acetylglucosamine malate deacetylase 1